MQWRIRKAPRLAQRVVSDSTGGTEATYRYDERGLRVRESLQKFDAGGDPVGPASDRAIHFNAMNPTGYAQIVEELVPSGGSGWQVARTSTIGRDVISTCAASGDRGLLANPSWHLLNYMRDPVRARTKRYEATVQYYHGRAADVPEESLDEFPFASTEEGGGQHSSVRPVNALENFAEGDMLSVFYRFMMKNKAGPFLGVLLPTVGE